MSNNLGNESTTKLAQAFSSIHWRWVIKAEDTTICTLFDALQSKLGHIEATTWPARLQHGGIYINGSPAIKLEQLLPKPCKIEYYEPKYNQAQSALFFPSFAAKQIVYQDDLLLVVYKPAGLPSMPARDQAIHSLKSQVEQHLGQTVHLPSRLDMSAQGLIIMSKSPLMHKPLQQCFETRSIKKTYLLLTANKPGWENLEVDAALGKDPAHPVLRKVAGLEPKSAHTSFKFIKQTAQGLFLIRANPSTGRTHQIRVHAAHSGIPIVGDKFYGDVAAENLCLLSYAIKLFHPFTEQELSFVLPKELCPKWLNCDNLINLSILS